MTIETMEVQARALVRLHILESARQHQDALDRSFAQANQQADRRYIAAFNDMVRRRHLRTFSNPTRKET